MNMKILIPVVIAIAVAAVYLLMNAPEGVSMGGESHDVTGGAQPHGAAGSAK